MDNNLILLLVIIVIAILFDLVNGFHDAANSIAAYCNEWTEAEDL